MKENKKAPVITIIESGPLKVSGSFTLLNENNYPIEAKSEVYLCRCGKSSNKPFCDGSHRNQ